MTRGPYEDEIAEALRERGHMALQSVRVGRLEVDIVTANACVEVTKSRQPCARTMSQARTEKIGSATGRGVLVVAGAEVFAHHPKLALDRIEAHLRRPPPPGCVRALRLW